MRYREFPPRPELIEHRRVHVGEHAVRQGGPGAARWLRRSRLALRRARGGGSRHRPDDQQPLAPGETVTGIRLRRGAAGPALGLPASELRDKRVAIADIWGASGRILRDRVGESTSRREVLEQALLSRLQQMETPDALVLAATRRLGLPGSRVATLAQTLGTSERQLLRRFNDSVGYGPKTLDRVLRFQRFRSIAATGTDLARAAADLGYADQAHLTRECVRLSGLTPGRLVAAR